MSRLERKRGKVTAEVGFTGGRNDTMLNTGRRQQGPFRCTAAGKNVKPPETIEFVLTNFKMMYR
jgi:hypothetical protein